jgi:hypothetical protein
VEKQPSVSETMEQPPRLEAATPVSPTLAKQKVGRLVAHFSQQNRPATPRPHRHRQNSENPRKSNPHNHFPPIRTPKPATQSPFPPLPLQSTKTHIQAHAFCPTRLASPYRKRQRPV